MSKAKTSGSSGNGTFTIRDKSYEESLRNITEDDIWDDSDFSEDTPKRVTIKVSNQNAGQKPKKTDRKITTAKTVSTSNTKKPTAKQAGSNKNKDVITLLNVLGDRLIKSEKERNDLKSAITTFGDTLKDMEGRTDNAEKAYIILQSKIQETEETAKDIKALYHEQKKQADKIAKAIEFADRIEAAIKQQARLNNRLDRFNEDRLRFDQKLNKIEKAVVKTQKSLKSKALLTTNDTYEDAETNAFVKWAGSRAAAQAVLLILLLTGALTIGYLLNGQSTSDLMRIQRFDTADNTGVSFDNNTFPMSGTSTSQNTGRNQTSRFTSTNQDQDFSDVYGQAQNPSTLNSPNESQKSDLEALFDANPDAVAEQLNALEPSSFAAENSAAPVFVVQDQTTRPQNEQAAQAPQFNLDEFLQKQTPSRPLADRAKPDPNLPSVAKDIETKAFNGVPTAQHDLGVIYSAGHGDIPVDYNKAYFWFKESALGGIANARYNLGVLHHQGLGADKDITKALNWYRAAASLNHPDAQYNLGIAHIEGVGTLYSPVKAAEYFENAAQSGVMEAAYNLGLIHENGLLGAPDADEAIYWYKEAIAKNSKEAQNALSQLSARLNMNEEDINRIYLEKKTLKSSKPDNSLTQDKASSVSINTSAQVQPQSADNETTSTAPDTSSLNSNTGIVPGGLTKNDKASNLDQSLTLKVQQHLYSLDLYPGPLNGIVTDRVIDAVMAYQNIYGLKQTGEVTQALLLHMTAEDIGDVGSRE